MAPKVSQAQQLVEAARNRAEFYRGSDEHSYARVMTPDGFMTYRVRSGSFRKWLRHLFLLEADKVPNAQALQDAINQLDATAEFSGRLEDVFVRVGERDGNVYIPHCRSWAEQWRVGDRRLGRRRVPCSRGRDFRLRIEP